MKFYNTVKYYVKKWGLKLLGLDHLKYVRVFPHRENRPPVILIMDVLNTSNDKSEIYEVAKDNFQGHTVTRIDRRDPAEVNINLVEDTSFPYSETDALGVAGATLGKYYEPEYTRMEFSKVTDNLEETEDAPNDV